MRVVVHTVENVRVLQELRERARGLRDLTATVGWHRAEGARPKTKRTWKGTLSTDWRTHVVDVALVHETGSYERRIPARPPHRTAYWNFDFRGGLVLTAVREYRDFLLRGKTGYKVLDALGKYWHDCFDRMFDGENDWDALSDRTLMDRYLKGNSSETVLVDTRQLRDTVTNQVQATSLVEKAVIP